MNTSEIGLTGIKGEINIQPLHDFLPLDDLLMPYPIFRPVTIWDYIANLATVFTNSKNMLRMALDPNSPPIIQHHVEARKDLQKLIITLTEAYSMLKSSPSMGLIATTSPNMEPKVLTIMGEEAYSIGSP